MAPYSRDETLLSIADVSLTLGGNSILRGVTAEVRNIRRPGLNQGQVVALLGPSGVGKTQLFKILAGLQSANHGQVLVTEKLIPVKAGMVGVVPQQYTLFRHRTILGNLVVAACERGHSADEAKKRAREYLVRFGLADKELAYPAQLSGGQRQRVAIIQQLLSSEHFLLMDEPFSGLDPLMKDQVCKLISEVASSNELSTIIVTTHDIESAVAIADTVWLMGRIRDEKGKSLGAHIITKYDLIEAGLAWQTDIQYSPKFHEMVNVIKTEFKKC